MTRGKRSSESGEGSPSHQSRWTWIRRHWATTAVVACYATLLLFPVFVTLMFLPQHPNWQGHDYIGLWGYAMLRAAQLIGVGSLIAVMYRGGTWQRFAIILPGAIHVLMVLKELGWVSA